MEPGRTSCRWVPLILVNLGGLVLAAGWSIAAVTLIALWAVDILTRVIDLIQLRD